MKRRRFHRSVIAAAVLTFVAAAPAAAQNYSCVGWFASTFAQADAGAFAAEISTQAHGSRPFGWTTVAPFAHIALEDCQGGD